MELKEDQVKPVMEAMRVYKKAIAKVVAANEEASNALTKLKNASGASGQGPQVLSEAELLIGQYYIRENG